MTPSFLSSISPSTASNAGTVLLFVTFNLVLSSLTKALTATAANKKVLKYIPFKNDVTNTLVVDCSHATANQITHHLKHKNQMKLMDLSLRGDSSTDGIINAIKANHPIIFSDNDYITSNHFDIDSFLSVFCGINTSIAIEYEEILREAAKIGDFRELRLDQEYQHISLKLACYLNSEERKLFYRPFESMSGITVSDGEVDGVDKFTHFLPIFHQVLKDVDQYKSCWIDEYSRVVSEYGEINNDSICRKNVYDNIGLVSIDMSQSSLLSSTYCHYYSLFSISSGYDIILSMYGNKRYELEVKYTTFIDLNSRSSLPRVELTTLCAYLNTIESEKKRPLSANLKWVCDKITDSGPILRIENDEKHLTKAERYGHPYERCIYESTIDSHAFEHIVISYLQFAYKYVNYEKKNDHSWTSLHEFNSRIQWDEWKHELLNSDDGYADNGKGVLSNVCTQQ